MSSIVSLSDDLAAHASGALWIASSRSLVVADLHLGYSWAQRRRGELGPLADQQAREKLLTVVEELRPSEIIFLGDIVHAPRPATLERRWIEHLLAKLAEKTRLVAVRGNHDRAFAAEFGHLPIKMLAVWQTSRVTAIHGDRFNVAVPENHTLLSGHLHPSMAVPDAAGASQRLPLFLYNRHCVVLPAFSPFARGFNVCGGLPEELATCFRGESIDAVALTGKRAISLGPLEDALRKMFSSDSGAAARFRTASPKKT